VVKHAGKPVAMAWFATFQGTLVFLKGMASAEGREVSALHKLIDGTIVECCGKHMHKWTSQAATKPTLRDFIPALVA
jgi:hypothetical protein